MAIAAPAAAGFALFVSILAAQLLSFLDHSSTTTTAQDFQLHGAVLLLLLAVMEAALFTAVSVFYRDRHAPHAAAAANGAGADHRRLSELVAFVSCVAVGLLQFFLFVQQPAGGVLDGGAQVHALGVAAFRALPASATVTFLLGVALVYLHVGTGGGGNGPVPEPAVLLLTEITLEAAAALIIMMAMAVYTT